ncbi:hypothetical protein CPLU01_08192 [Colletotrichum plurivorum]|uniref:Uncharacterized protein n=1 Tax=Colletotrichum plurivorum TaxID=2175906 RepID=A0A8H6NCY2_9PEZI|nr:hypothetical protein CPLU01_08192 [Colletotrichum plurivorum]
MNNRVKRLKAMLEERNTPDQSAAPVSVMNAQERHEAVFSPIQSSTNLTDGAAAKRAQLHLEDPPPLERISGAPDAESQKSSELTVHAWKQFETWSLNQAVCAGDMEPLDEGYLPDKIARKQGYEDYDHALPDARDTECRLMGHQLAGNSISISFTQLTILPVAEDGHLRAQHHQHY